MTTTTTTPRKSRTAVVALATVLIVAIGAAAFAYWTSNGTGQGQGTTGTSGNFTVTTDPPTGPALKPGFGTQTIGYTVTNSATSAQQLTTLTVSIKTAAGALWESVPGCSAADFTLVHADITPVQLASGATYNGTVELSMINAPTNQDGCKLADVPLFFVAS